MKFGEFLVSRGEVSREAVDEALSIQRFTKARVGRTLRDLGYVTQEALDEALGAYAGPQEQISVDDLTTRLVPFDPSSLYWTAAGRFDAVPLQAGSGAVFAVARFRDELIEEIERLSPATDTSLVILPSEILTTLQSCGRAPEKFAAPRSVVLITKDESDDEKLNEAHPYTRLMRECVAVAKGLKASDIHVEPTDRGFTIRHRVHGELVTWKELAAEHRDPFVAKIKRVVNLDLAVVGRPQDSRASFPAFKLDARVSALPLIYGDKIVLRVLDWERRFDLAASGVEPVASVEMLRRAVQHKDGLVIISGPTGSGKTTTLYSLLNTLDAARLNICTLENPVEYRFAGINQVDIAPGRGLSFANALRSLMRQDPDVILVGEIRDEETAELALQASSTGHLVLSTLHANSAAEAVDRLCHLGIKRTDLSGTLRLSAAQRLMRRLCLVCSIPLPESTTFPHTPVLPHGTQLSLRQRRPEGCAACQNGVTGRVAVLECMEEEAVRALCAADGSKGDPSKSFASLRDMAWSLAATGTVDATEAMTL